MKLNREKILFVYEEDKEYKIESLWAKNIDGNYKIDNVPFFINNIANGDIVSIEKDGDELYFEDLIKTSGNSTIQLVILGDLSKKEVGLQFEKLNCNWEGSHLPKYLSIDIPRNVEYKEVENLLKDGSFKNIWDYKEACLSDNHNSENHLKET
jgi:hypothetical protein